MDFRRQLALLLIGGFVGAAISAGFNAVATGDPGTSNTKAALLGGALLLLGLLASTRTLGSIKHVLSSSRGIRAEGHWAGYFEYEKSGELVRVEEDLQITQVGLLLRGRSTSTRIDGDFPLKRTTYDFSAVLASDGTFSGSWKSIAVRGRYHGLLLGRISRHGGRIDGVWIGIEEPQSRKGDFTWVKAS
ncbi:hypothetical protein DKT68_14525 [Micromonospora acroterricola]|uniref:SMODS-associating 2TM beta-strand rich effector domain-containing protein n=1 Tax=Micromonospora acroterricola TaxID=2202421 RepID=A0A317D2H6_9ACTN|nr:hypothetical protein [Micromonospora acroterricola]PWR08777.1 hypothetical protein DKT68_14525 [Micromonospora acroterricola]